MAVLALSDLRTRILARSHLQTHLLDSDTNNATTGQATLDGLINQAKDDLVAEHNFTWKRGRASFSTSPAVFRHPLPADFQRPIAFYVVDSWKLDPLTLNEFRSQVQDAGDNTGTPVHYILGNDEVEFWPRGTKTVELDYYKAFPDLVANGDTLTVTSGVPAGIGTIFQEAVINKALETIFSDFQHDERGAQRAEVRYARNLDRLIDMDTNPDAVYSLESHAVEEFAVPRLPASYGVR